MQAGIMMSFAAVLGCSLEGFFVFFFNGAIQSQLKVHNSASGWLVASLVCFYNSYVCMHIYILEHKHKHPCALPVRGQAHPARSLDCLQVITWPHSWSTA